MKKALLIISMFAAVAAISIPFSFEADSNTSGAPSAKTGGPGDNGNCTSCHSGTAATVAGLITSNIPATGYVQGVTYTITASISVAGINKFGFEVSAQNASGTKVGTLVVTNSVETQLVGASKYITHKTAGTAGSGSKTWSFNWTAPASSTGPITFYGAFNAANANNQSTGDQIKLSTLTVQPDLTSIEENYNASKLLNVYPNPVQDELTLACEIPQKDIKFVTIINAEGKLVKKLEHESMQDGKLTADVSSLPRGIYFITVQTASATATKRIIKL
jgi:hypothetical protein